MSLTPAFAPDAKSQWQELDILLQERVLDELDKLAAVPPDAPRGVALHDFVHVIGEVRNYIFMRIVIDLASQRITIIGIFHHESRHA